MGGHCIGIDPYYLTFKALNVGYKPEIILSCRKINDNMGIFIVDKVIKLLKKQGIDPKNSNVTILGLTLRKTAPDLRNTRTIDIFNQLKRYNINIKISDECASSDDVMEKFGVELTPISSIFDQDAIIVAVSHTPYLKLSEIQLGKMLRANGVLIDVKSIYKHGILLGKKRYHWRL